MSKKKKKMKKSDKDEIIKKMMDGSDLLKKNKNKGLKAFRRKIEDGSASKKHKNKLGRHMNISPKCEIGE